MTDKKKIYLRCAIVFFWVTALTLAIYVCIKNPIENNVYGILIHNENLFHCPSCGLTRAVYSLMRLDFKSAFYYHAYFTVTAPVWCYAMFCLSVNLWANRKIIPYPKKYTVVLWVLFAGWMLFSILRNFVEFIY